MEIDLWELPKQTHLPSPLCFNQEETAATDKLIQELLAKNAICTCERETGDFVSTIFLQRKPNGSYRMILNLKNFNKYVDYCKFKMDTLIKILALVMPGVFMCSLDLSDAYLSVLISALFSRFLKFEWRGQLFKFIAMPFGLTEAPRKFTKLLKPPLSVIRHAGFTISAYLDDFFQCEKTREFCRQAICFAYNLLVSLGFLPNDSKSVYEPTQRIESLGHIIDSVDMLVSLPPSKTECIISLFVQATNNPTFSIRHLCTLIGKMISCLVAHPMGRLHYRTLERLKIAHLHACAGNYEADITLNTACIHDLNWWIQTLPSACAPIDRGPCTSVFTCDASKQGWSACFNGQKAQGQFSLLEAPHSTNTKEIYAVLFGLQAHWRYLQNQHILIMSDSTTAISVIKNMGSMDSLIHDRLAQETWHFAESKGIWISMTYIPGKANIESDEGSRVFNENTEWALPQQIFDKLIHHFRSSGPVITNLFASRLNFKLKPYISWGPDPFSVHVDAFTIQWNSPYTYYAYPPFSIIPRVLKKVHQDQATVLLVFPFWSTQMWFTTLMSMLVSSIVVLPEDPPIFLPFRPDFRHPMTSKVRLCSAIVSGRVSKQTTFLKSLHNLSSTANPRHTRQISDLSCLSGTSFAWQGKLIPVTRLRNRWEFT